MPLNLQLENYINEFDFSIFTDLDPANLINDLEGTKYYVQWFGGGIAKPRPLSEIPPQNIHTNEMIYVNQLLKAYNEHINDNIDIIHKLKQHQGEYSHFERQRISFYEAESLQKYVRESLNEELFLDLQEELYDGLIDIVEEDHVSGYECLKETLAESKRLDLSGNVLNNTKIVKIKDRYGICHQLVNTERFNWVKYEK